ncbi:MAG: hypothetical protein NTW91_10320 [Verrucomicrobia bacterium]|nr:hypothetical protein [Verrucomicrobiota bacterium]
MDSEFIPFGSDSMMWRVIFCQHSASVSGFGMAHWTVRSGRRSTDFFLSSWGFVRHLFDMLPVVFDRKNSALRFGLLRRRMRHCLSQHEASPSKAYEGIVSGGWGRINSRVAESHVTVSSEEHGRRAGDKASLLVMKSNCPLPMKVTPRKIVLVGGGSYNWSPRLLCDLVQTPELEGSEVVLLDLNQEAAAEVKAAIDRVCADEGKKFRFTVSCREEDAFQDADFVLITISTGGLDTMRHDLEIPDRYRIYQTVGDSVGPGGWSRLLRNVPVFVEMVRKIERLAPRAVILNYTNPMAGLTGAVAQSCSLRHVGLCHGLFGTLDYVARMFGAEREDLVVRCGGVNHFFWITDFKVRGADGYPLLREILDGATLLKFDKVSRDSAGFSDNNHAVFSELFEHFGYLTYSADRHTSEYFNRYLTDRAAMEKYHLARTTIEDRAAGIAKARKFTSDLASGKQALLPKSMETAVDIMKAISIDQPIYDVMNVPNIGQIANLPLGAVVETMGRVDATGFTPAAIGRLPAAVAALCEVHCQVQIMTLEAAMNGNRKLAIEALTLDPLCAHLGLSEIRQMADELLAANRDYLPQFR